MRLALRLLPVLALATLGVACTDGGGGGVPGAGGRPHVVLVHGFTAEALPSWAVFTPALAAAGFQSTDFRYPSLTIGADAAAQLLGQRVSAIAATGQQVALVGHSEGGLITKACIIFYGCRGKVSHWFNISGVNNGTTISAGLPGTAIGDMGVTSILVNRLKANNATFRQQNIKCRVAWTPGDTLVIPPTLSREPSLGCGETMIPVSTHFTIIMDPTVIQSAIQLFRT